MVNFKFLYLTTGTTNSATLPQLDVKLLTLLSSLSWVLLYIAIFQCMFMIYDLLFEQQAALTKQVHRNA